MNYYRPTEVLKPSVDAFAFIDIKFFQKDIGIKHIKVGRNWPTVDQDHVFSTSNFVSPDLVTPEQMAPTQGMSEATAEALFRILKPTMPNGLVITTKNSLASYAADVFHKFCAADAESSAFDRPVTLDQLQSHLLSHAKPAEGIHWGQIADLYNGTTGVQRDAIHQFFAKTYNRQLESLMDTPAPKFELPTSLQETFLVQVDGTETSLFSETQDQWLPEARFHQQFHIHGQQKETGKAFLLASAPTLTQALAKASIFANKQTAMANDIESVSIRLAGAELAKADLKSIKSAKQVSFVEAIGTRMKLSWNLEGLSHRSQESFCKTLLTVEDAIGVKWTKAKQHEDALGL